MASFVFLLGMTYLNKPVQLSLHDLGLGLQIVPKGSVQ